MTDASARHRYPSPSPEHVVTVRDEGGEPFGWLVVDRRVQGLAFGGFRMTYDVTEGEVHKLAQAMTWKLAAHGSPVGGAKAGMRCDPTADTTPQRLAIFAAAVRSWLADGVVLGKDMGATNALIDGMYASIRLAQLDCIQQRFSDCPSTLRQLSGYRTAMTGLGVAWSTRAALLGDIQGARVAIQGAGVVGQGAAQRLRELGADIVAMSDIRGVIDSSAGLQGARIGGPEALFDCPADVLVLAASSDSVDVEDANRIQANIVIEGSNFGLTEAARMILQSRGITVIPDIIASSSSAAMVTRQMACGGALSSSELWHAIETDIDQATRDGVGLASELGVDVRTAHLLRSGFITDKAVAKGEEDRGS